MSKRYLAASAIAALAVVSLAPGAALAAGTSGVHSGTAASPFVKGKVTSPLTSGFKTYKTNFYGKLHAATSTDASISGVLVLAPTSALGVAALPELSDSAGTITQYTFDFGDNSGIVTVTAAQLLADNGEVDHQYAAMGTYNVTVTATDSASDTFTATETFTTAGSEYTADGPTRLLDTRKGIGAPQAKVKAGGVVKLKVAGTGNIPAGVTAVVLNLTVTNATGTGFVKAYGDEDGVPSVSNVNYVSGQTVPNLAIVQVGADGYVDLQNGGAAAGAIDLLADVTGYFSPTVQNGYTPLPAPDRLVDTRYGTGAPKAAVAKGGTVAVQVAGNDGGLLPASGITAVALNVTVTAPTGSGFLEAYPAETTAPGTSNVNYGKGQTIANAVIVPVGANGQVDITNGGASAGTVQVIVDVTGYYSASSPGMYVAIPPQRIEDTRNPADLYYGPLPNDYYMPMPLAVDNNGNDVPSVTAAVLNATVTNTKGAGFLAEAPDPNQWTTTSPVTAPQPGTSSLNWTKGETVPNLIQAGTGSTGVVDFWNLGKGGGNTDVILDLFGYYFTS